MKFLFSCALLCLVANAALHLNAMTGAPVQSQQAIRCAICLENCEHSTKESRALPCGHLFHIRCIGKWVSVAKIAACPICRAEIMDLALLDLLLEAVAIPVEPGLSVPAVPVQGVEESQILAAAAAPGVAIFQSAIDWREADDFERRALLLGRQMSSMSIGLHHWLGS